MNSLRLGKIQIYTGVLNNKTLNHISFIFRLFREWTMHSMSHCIRFLFDLAKIGLCESARVAFDFFFIFTFSAFFAFLFHFPEKKISTVSFESTRMHLKN